MTEENMEKHPLPWHMMIGNKFQTDETYVTGTNQILTNVHTREMCRGHQRHCVIHNPSPHRLIHAPTHWRVHWVDDEEFGGQELVQIMERICTHGVFHPDIDDLIFIGETKGHDAAMLASKHECCPYGCCSAW